MKLLLTLIGAWIGCTIFMALVAIVNFRTVNRVISHPTPQAGPVLAGISAQVRRPLLRHLVSEVNRRFFFGWGWVQVALGGAVLVLLVARHSSGAAIALGAVALAVVCAELLLLVPPIVTLGRVMDFLPRETPPPQMALFGRLHATYSILDLVKLAALAVLAWRIR